MTTPKMDEILKALQKGPLTWRLLAVELGYEFATSSWWEWCRRKTMHHNQDELEKTLADMVKVGLIVRLDTPGKPWALLKRDACPTCWLPRAPSTGKAPSEQRWPLLRCSCSRALSRQLPSYGEP